MPITVKNEEVEQLAREAAKVGRTSLTEAIRRRGLVALKEHFERLYTTEGGRIEIALRDAEMTLKVAACPAVMHMRKTGYPVAELFHETTRTVNAAICEEAGFTAELTEYDPETGRSVQRFYRSVQE